MLHTVLLNDVAVLRLWLKSLKINCEKIYFSSKVIACSQVLLYTAYTKKLVVHEKQIFWFAQKLNVRKKMRENNKGN